MTMGVTLFLFLALASADGREAPPDGLAKPRLVVYKRARRLELYDGDKLVRAFPVALGSNPVPPKRKEGDRATPEGEYHTCGKIPKSAYHMALVLDYPNAEDAERGFKAGVISKKERDAIRRAIAGKRCPPFGTGLGGQVEIHGMGSQSDWTWGCIALDNPDIEALYKALPNGTPVVIKP